MQVPCGAVLESHTFQQDLLAIHEMQHHRTKERLHFDPEGIVCDHRHILIDAVSLREHRTRIRIPDIVLYDAAFLFEVFLPLVLRHLALLERAPPIAVSVKSTMSGDSDILCASRIDRAGAALGRDTFEPLVVDLIQVEVVREEDETVRLGVKTYIGFHRDRAGDIESGRNDHCTASGRRTFVNSLLDGCCSQFNAGGISAIVFDVEGLVREGRYRYFRHVEGSRGCQGVDRLLSGGLILRLLRVGASA